MRYDKAILGVAGIIMQVPYESVPSTYFINIHFMAISIRRDNIACTFKRVPRLVTTRKHYIGVFVNYLLE